jgi:hypothetical protein
VVKILKRLPDGNISAAHLSVLYNRLIRQHTPISHPFVERLIGTIRREYFDQTLFWNAVDLEKKLRAFQEYYNDSRVHAALDGDTPAQISRNSITRQADLESYRWQSHCRGLVQLPMVA